MVERHGAVLDHARRRPRVTPQQAVLMVPILLAVRQAQRAVSTATFEPRLLCHKDFYKADLGVARVPSAQHWRFACRQGARGFAAPAVVPSVTLAPPAGLPTLPERERERESRHRGQTTNGKSVVMFVPCESQGLP